MTNNNNNNNNNYQGIDEKRLRDIRRLNKALGVKKEMSLEDKLERAKLMPWKYNEETGELMTEEEKEAKRHMGATRAMMEKAIDPKGERRFPFN